MSPSVSGFVSGPDGSPLHDIRIEIRSLSTDKLVRTCYSNLTGNFEISGLRAGEYELVAQDGISETREQVSVQSGMASVNVRMSNHVNAAPTRGTVSVAELKVPEKARHLVDKARGALEKNRADEANKYVNEALALAPDYAGGLTLRAAIYLDGNQSDAAIEDLDHAIQANPTFGPAYLVLGAVYNKLGRFDEALRSLDRSSMYEPKSWQCAFEMAKAWLGKNDFQHALQQVDRAQSLSMGKMTGAIHVVRAYALLGQKDFVKAATELEAYLAAEPAGPSAGSVRTMLARIKTEMALRENAVTLTPAMEGFFGTAH